MFYVIDSLMLSDLAMRYADALVFANKFKARTRQHLEDVLAAHWNGDTEQQRRAVLTLQMHLSLVLNEMNIQPDRQKMCV